MTPAGNDALFRREALEAANRSWLGETTIAQPLPLWALTAFALAAASVVVLFLASGEYTRRSRVAGQLVPDLGLVTVAAPTAGVVAAPMPDEGEEVMGGQPLLVIATPRATTAGGEVTAGLLRGLDARRAGLEHGYESRRELLEVQSQGYERQLATAREELRQIEAAIAVQEERVAIAREVLAHFRELAAKQHASRLQLSQQQQGLLEQVAMLRALGRQALVARRNIEELAQALEALPAEVAALAAERTLELAALDQERLQVRAGGEVMMQAPVTGLVASRLIERGQTVAAGQPLLSLLPAGSRLQAQLLVPSRAAGFIEPGDAVELRYQAYPHQKFGHHRGRVLRISRHALGTRELGALTGGAPAAEPHYRVLVELPEQSIMAYGQREALLPGMVLEADILGERRKLYEWVLEPLWSLRGRL
jgi:membrane fusion protein